MSDGQHIVCPHCAATNRVPASKNASAGKCGKCHNPLFTGHAVPATAATFAKHIQQNDIPVVVDFWADWCGPCKMMAPAYQQAAQQLEPEMRLLKVDTEQAQDLAAQFNIRSIPTLALFKNGREIARQAGAMDAGSIVSWAKAQAASALHG